MEITCSLKAFEMQVTFFGAYYPDAMLPRLRKEALQGAAHGVVARFYEAWIAGFLDSYELWLQGRKEGLAVLADIYLEALSAPFQLLLCVTPLWFCAPLAALNQAPLLIYLDDLPDQMPPEDFVPVASWLREAASLLAPAPLVAALTERLLGKRPKVAAWVCDYVGRKWSAPSSRVIWMLRNERWPPERDKNIFS